MPFQQSAELALVETIPSGDGSLADVNHHLDAVLLLQLDETVAAPVKMAAEVDGIHELPGSGVENIYVRGVFTSMAQELSDFPGLYIGMGDVMEDGEKVAECIFNLEVMLEGSDTIGAEGSFVEVTNGDLNLEERREIFFTLQGVISRDHEYYVTEFPCFTNTSLWPKFMIPKAMKIIENISETGEAPEAEESDEYD